MQQFDELSVNEAVVLTFNFSRALAPLPGVLLTGTPVVTFGTVYGGDPSPQLVANGPAAIDPTGTLVWVPVIGRMDQNNYIIVVQCPTTNASWGLTLPAILPVRAFPSIPGVP
jgi:hypothetical protein